MNENHQGTNPTSIAVKFKKKLERSVGDKLFFTGGISKRQDKKQRSDNTEISPYPDEMRNMKNVVKCYSGDDQQEIRDRKRYGSLYKD